MSRRKKVPTKPAPPVATNPDIQYGESIARLMISEIRQTDPDKAISMSTQLSLSVTRADDLVLKGADLSPAGTKRQRVVWGTEEEVADRHELIRTTYLEVRAERPDWPKKSVQHWVSGDGKDRKGWSLRSIERVTSDLK